MKAHNKRKIKTRARISISARDASWAGGPAGQAEALAEGEGLVHLLAVVQLGDEVEQRGATVEAKPEVGDDDIHVDLARWNKNTGWLVV